MLGLDPSIQPLRFLRRRWLDPRLRWDRVKPDDDGFKGVEATMIRFLAQAVVTALGLWLAAQIIPGVGFTDTLTLVIAAVVLGLINAFVRPILVILTFPITVITLGLFLLVVNAATIGLTAVLLDGFVVDGLWAGVGAAIVTGVVSWIAGALIGNGERRGPD